MYAVVGCTECSALWILADRPETTQCPRCGKRHQTKRLKRFVETDDRDHAREARASMLANRQGEGEAFADLDSFGELETRLDDAGIDDETYLESSGIDPDAVAEAVERAGRSAGGGGSRRETVLEALRTVDQPTEEDVIEYAGERGVPENYVITALEKLVRAGTVTEDGGIYRLV